MESVMPELKRGTGCKWPMWPHASRPTHEYCDEERVSGRAYCRQHYAISVRNKDEKPSKAFVQRRFAA